VFGRPKPVVFESYGRRRSRWRLPRWLLLLIGGIVVGAAGVIVLQERYLPPRLSADASAELRGAFEQADTDRTRLKTELAHALKQLETETAEKSRLSEVLASQRASAELLRDDLAAVVAAMPPDPRGGSVEVRAGRFTAQGSVLNYNIVLQRDRNDGKPLTGVVQLIVAGESERGTPTTLSLKPIALSMGGHAVVRGSQPLPEGFKPRQTTVQVLDRAAGKALGMRVMLVQ